MSSDTIIRVSKTERYAIIDKQFLDEDARLTWKAKGLLTYFLAKPDGWQIRRSDLIKRSADGKDSVSAGLKELEQFGYLERKMVRQNGKFGYENIIHERPEILDIKPFPPGRKIRSGSTVAENPLRKIRCLVINKNKDKDQQPEVDLITIVDPVSDEKDAVAAVVVSSQPEIMIEKQDGPATDDGTEKKAMTPTPATTKGVINVKLMDKPARPLAATAAADKPDKPHVTLREVQKVNNYAVGRGLAHAAGNYTRPRGFTADPAVKEVINYAAERGVSNMNGNLALTLLTGAGGNLDLVKGAVDRFAKFAYTSPVHKPNRVLIDALDWPPEVKFDRNIYKQNLSEEREKRLAEKEKKYENIYLS